MVPHCFLHGLEFIVFFILNPDELQELSPCLMNRDGFLLSPTAYVQMWTQQMSQKGTKLSQIHRAVRLNPFFQLSAPLVLFTATHFIHVRRKHILVVPSMSLPMVSAGTRPQPFWRSQQTKRVLNSAFPDSAPIAVTLTLPSIWNVIATLLAIHKNVLLLRLASF